MRMASHYALPTGLAIAHALFVLTFYSMRIEGSWGAIYFVFPDFPVVMLLAFMGSYLSHEGFWVLLAIFGSMWWFGLGMVAQSFFRRVAHARKTRD